jgi:hypothetical protein
MSGSVEHLLRRYSVKPSIEPADMKRDLLLVLILVAIMNVGDAFGQRFTSKGETAQTTERTDTGFVSAEKAYLALKAGKLDEARKLLSSADPSNPFAMYVRASLTRDATEGVAVYRLIVNEFPNRPIAGEALLQLYKYHYATGEYSLAHTDYLQLHKYPGMNQLVDPAGLRDTLPAPASATEPVRTTGTKLPTQPAVSSETHYSIQLGAFSTRENAERFVSRLKDEDIDGSISSRVLSDRTLYVVTAGNFDTREEAEAVAKDLKSRSINCIVVEAGEAQE